MKPYYYKDNSGKYNGGKLSPEDEEAAIYYDTIINKKPSKNTLSTKKLKI